MKAVLAKPFIGTTLTIGGALTTISLAPLFWLVAGIAYVALPA